MTPSAQASVTDDIGQTGLLRAASMYTSSWVAAPGDRVNQIDLKVAVRTWGVHFSAGMAEAIMI